MLRRVGLRAILRLEVTVAQSARTTLLLWSALAAGCSIFDNGNAKGPEPVGGADGSDGTDGTDGTTGADGADGSDGLDGADGTGDGTDGTSDGTDGTDGFDCSEQLTPSPTIDGCVTEELACGSSIRDTTQGGTFNLGGEGYREWFCTTAGDSDYLGQERIYAFTHPGDVDVTIELNSPCDDLELFVIEWAAWDSDGSCPTNDALISNCEHDGPDDGGSVFLPGLGRSYDYLIAVEGSDPIDSIFELTVACP